MLTLLGFLLFLAPISLVGAYGIKRLLESKGKIASSMFLLSIPFYFISIKAMIEEVQTSMQSISFGEEPTFLASLSPFEWFSIGMLLLCMALCSVFSMLYQNGKLK